MANEMIIGFEGVPQIADSGQTAEITAIQTQLAAEKTAAEQAAAETLEARKAPLRRLGLTENEINTVLGL